jgi:hypothetical protein
VPTLTNPKHELFAQQLAQGKTASEAYVSAGYRPSRQNAARLRSKDDIAARVQEIQAAGAKSAEVSVQSLLAELEAARERATSLNQLSAAVRAISEKAKISGLLVKRQEVQVSGPDFPEPQSIAEILDRVRYEVGEKAAKALADAFECEWTPAVDATPASTSPKLIDWQPPRRRKREVG